MNLHQVLTGAANEGDYCLSVGSVDGSHFTAYAAGSNIVVLDGDFNRVQVISGSSHDLKSEVTCIVCCRELGKIAASCEDKLYIFEPVPVIHAEHNQAFNYQWSESCVLVMEANICILAWNYYGSRLITSLSNGVLQMWEEPDQQHESCDQQKTNEKMPEFFIGESEATENKSSESTWPNWVCVWSCKLPNPVVKVKFSTDGLFFATSAHNDKLVKIWYENLKASSSSLDSSLSFSSIFIAHPKPVTGFTWRKSSKYIYKGCIANMLLTTCQDAICRIWSETFLPDDPMTDVTHKGSSSSVEQKESFFGHFRNRHRYHKENDRGNKHRFLHRLTHIKKILNTKKKSGTKASLNSLQTQSSSSSYHINDSFNHILADVHFHLAASIDFNADIPMRDTFENGAWPTTFVSHWLNNKEFQTNSSVEQILSCMTTDACLLKGTQNAPPATSPVVTTPNSPHAPLSPTSLSPDPSPATHSLDKSLNVTKLPKNNTDLDITSYACHTMHSPTHLNEQHKDYDSHMDQLIHQWNEASDVLFSIHPNDGSLLIWTIHYLDEAGPGMYRQPQVSFNSRLPKAFPAYDAASMHTAPRLYYESSRGQQQINALRALNAEDSCCHEGIKMNQGNSEVSTPRVLLLSKHINGSLNLWNISFSSTCNFSHAISVTHLRRICGHRFHAVASTCHPTLPLLLSTSHFDHEGDSGTFSHSKGHCTELILWKVMPIGPLSKSGGILELARVNSPICSAFLHVAWLPSLLPISSLTNKSWTSPSSLFIASNGLSLKVYQAVFDARCILSDLKTCATKGSSPMLKRRHSISAPAYNVISHQSTEKPGCIIDLMPINDAQKSWNNIQLMHVFQEKIVTGTSTSTAHNQVYYLVIFQKLCGSSKLPEDIVYGTGVHAWRLTVSYKASVDSFQGNNLRVSSSKICYHLLPLPHGVSVQSATVAVAHLSSSSIYPTCRPPYLISTACSDSQVYFWRCKMEGDKMVWLQWEPLASYTHSRITVSGELLCVSCAYSGRIALLYKCSKQVPRIEHEEEDGGEEEGVKEQKMRLKEMFSGLKVVIYQCESTGGSEWQVEDTIPLQCISLPNILFKIHPSISHHHPPKYLRQAPLDSKDSGHRVSAHFQIHSAAANYHHEPIRASIPSSASLHNLTKLISSHTPLLPNSTKPIVFLDWVSAENGSHVLTVGVGSKIMLYVPTNNTLETMGRQNEGNNDVAKRGKLQKSMTLALANTKPQRTKWMQVRCIELQTHDGMAPFPKHLSWVRNGILVVGLDNEMQIYSQWPDFNTAIADACVVGEGDAGVKKDSKNEYEDVANQSHLLPRNQSVVLSLSKSLSSAWLIDSEFTNHSHTEELVREGVKSKAGKLCSGVLGNEDLNKVGLFEAARMTSPCIPQFHPKLLLELLNFGKVKRVKVILWHLLRCIVGNQQNIVRTNFNSAVNITNTSDATLWGTANVVGNEFEDNSSGSSEDEGLKIESIPPLPLYALFAADDAVSTDVTNTNAKVKGSRTNDEQYDELFAVDNDLTSKDDPFIDLDPDASAAKEQQQQQAKITNLGPPGTFGPSQASILSKHLTRVSLPGLSSLDQMYLLALAETVASTRLEFAEQSKVSGHEDVKASSRKNGVNQSNDTNLSDHSIVDNCGLRFLLASRHFTYLLNTLPLRQRVQLLKRGLSSSEFTWAFHSDSQQELLHSLPCMSKGTPTWSDLKMFGVGWWLRNIDSLTSLMEKVAKAAFQANKDPLDSALFYLAMKKKNILWGLFRSVNDSRMAQFFKNDFNEDRWRKAALKNAFKLIGLQKFQCAAAFFLLGGSVKDTVEVCLKNMNDIQLAMVVLRLYENQVDSANDLTCKKLLKMKVLGQGEGEENVRSYDPFLRSMASWVLNDYVGSLETLLEEDDGDEVEDVGSFTRQSSFKVRTPRLNKGLGYSGSNLGGATEFTSSVDGSTKLIARSSVFNFYVFLRTHPLIIRQQKICHPNRQVNQTGFINSVERRLFYMTAHEHFLNGCPILALEVLLKLNPLMEEDEEDSWKEKLPNGDDQSLKTETAEILMKAEDFDWSQPLSLPNEPKLDISPLSSPVSSPSSSTHASNQALNALHKKEGEENSVSEDMMAQQLKFVACLRMITDELATLATGFGLDGGQLRFHLYYWLEKEVNVLKKVCNYYLEEVEDHIDEEAVLMSKEVLVTEVEDEKDSTKRQSIEIPTSIVEDTQKNSPKLHEVLEAESKSYDARNRRLRRRHIWLRANQNLLVTLLGCAVLHGSRDTGFASIRTELLLLLQELQQDPSLASTDAKDVTPLHTPLPLLNTTLLTSTSFHANLIQHLNNMKYDILMTLISMQAPPNSHNYTPQKILNLFNVGLALSSCMHQSLSDNDSFSVSDTGLLSLLSNKDHKTSHLMAGIALDDIYEAPTSEPLQWPGISSFCTLMQRRHETHQLHILLLETFISVLLALLAYALSYYDAHLLYHLVARKLTNECWGVVFGGAVRSLMKVTTEGSEEEACKHRVKLTTSAIGAQILHQRYNINRSSYKEKFVRPKMSVFDFFLSKPPTDSMSTTQQSTYTNSENNDGEVDGSDDDDDDDDDYYYDGETFNTSPTKKKKESKTDTTHLNADSLAWKLIRYASVRCININISSFLANIGFDAEELAHNSALLSEATRNLLTWEDELKKEVDNTEERFNISGLFVDTSEDCPHKYHTLFHPNNSPFRSCHKAARPVRRLWFCLAGNPQITDIFIKHVFAGHTTQQTSEGKVKVEEEEMKIIHKDQEVISTFAINQMNLNCIAMATNKEIIEVDMNNILDTPEWLQHDLDYDIEFIKNKMPQYDKPEDFLLLKTPYDYQLLNGALVPNTQEKNSKQHNASTIIIKRPECGVKKMHSHPLLPFYVSGSVDGGVKLWEWGHHKPVSQVRKAGAFPRVTKVLFSNHGNKIGITDGEGNLSLWQVGSGSNINKPYFNIKCNNKTTYDMAFLSSSSLVCTAGHSTDQRNISIWDSLMPSKKMLVQSFLCHTDGCPVVVYAPNHQTLISGGKKGEICIFDIRQRQLRHTIQAHNSPIKTICLHPSLDVFVSGAADGDIKIWSINSNQLLSTFPAEHCKPASALFRNVSSGVLQLEVSQQGHLFSCGNDGTMKIRKLYDVTNQNGVSNDDDITKERKTSIFSSSSLSNRGSRINSLSVF